MGIDPGDFLIIALVFLIVAVLIVVVLPYLGGGRRR
jgi:hypothetical protein